MKLYSKIYGKNPQDLIIIHGLFGMSDNWNSIGKKFTKYFRVHLIDLRNHGKSPHADEFNYEVMAGDILEYIDDYGIHPIILGHSLGGKVAMKIAFTSPEKIKRLIVADISPRRYSIDFHKNLLKQISRLDLTEFNNRNEVEKAVSLFIEDIGTRLFLLKNLYRNENKLFSWKFNIKVLLEKLSNIQEASFIEGVCNIPTSFIRGANSDYINREDQILINKHFSNVSISTIKNAGHWIHAENPETFYNKVIGFCLS